MNEMDESEFSGWASYPQNLGFSPFEVDARISNERLAGSRDKLFSDADDNSLGFLDFGPVFQDGTRDVEYGVVESAAQLSRCFKRPFSSWVFFLRQNYTWSQLRISEELLRKLFTRLKVHPDFLEVLLSFGEKIGPVEESFGSFFSHCHRQQQENRHIKHMVCSYNIGYNIKYAARHLRKYPTDPFSIRETGVYHSFLADTQVSNWIFIQASEPLEGRLQKCFEHADETIPLLQFKLHGMVLQVVSEGWRDYIVYLEDRFAQMVDRGFYTNVTGPQLEGDTEIDFGDIRKLQILMDKLERILQIVKLNTEIALQMKGAIDHIKTCSPTSMSADFDYVGSQIDGFTVQHRIHVSRLQSLVDRGKGIRLFIQQILDFKAAEQGRKINSRMEELARQGVQENRFIKSLTLQTTEDTKSTKMITLITAIFFPATFLASLFGTNFFSFQGGELAIASNFWIYVIAAVLLSGLSVIAWRWWSRRTGPEPKEDIEAFAEKNDSPA